MDAWVAALLSIAALVAAPPPRRCLLFQKVCVAHCPQQMHPYHTRCNKDTMSQRTCTSPTIYSLGYSCGWSRCDCNGAMLYDEIQGFCVYESECIVFSGKKFRNRRRKQKVRISKKLRLDDEDEMFEKPFQTGRI